MANKKLVIIGGGAAGFFCAVNAAALRSDLDVILLEKSNKLLSKVKVSGGGRCNVTHACFDIAAMSRKYPRGGNFVKKTFHQFFTTDTIEWFRKRGVGLKTETDGRMFPVSDSSQTIIDCLLDEAGRRNVEIRMKSEVISINRKPGHFELELNDAEKLKADFVCIACGGYPKTAMFNWIQRTGHHIEEPVPSLFTFNLPKHPITALMGVSVPDVRIKIQNPAGAGTKLQQQGPVLITHWGLSGPAVLRLSAWGARQLAKTNWQFSILINWLPEFKEQSLQERFQVLRSENASQKIYNRNPFGLPQRLWEFLVEQTGVDKEKRWADLALKEQHRLVKSLCAGEFPVSGKTTFKEEFVTAGGICLSEVDANTLMSKKVPNLFFAGEILDVDGVTGGFNFQHAWTSGFIAAKSIALASPEIDE